MARYELNLRDYYRILRRHLIVIVAVTIGLGGLSFVMALESRIEQTYTATSRVQISQVSNVVDMVLQTFTYSSGNYIATQSMLISSQPVLWETLKLLDTTIDTTITFQQVLNDDDLKDQYWDLIGSFRGSIRAMQVGPSGLIDIIATDRTGQRAMDLAEKAAEGFKRYSRIQANEQNEEAKRWINERLITVRRDLRALQDSLKVVRQRTISFSSFDETSLSRLIERRTTLEDRASTLTELKLRLLEGEVGFSTVGAAVDPTILTQYTDSYSELSTLLNNRGQQLLTYTESAEPIRILDERIRAVKRELISSIDRDLDLLRDNLATYDRLLEAYPDEEIEMATLTRQVDLKTQLVTQLEASLEEVEIRSASTRGEVSIVGYPTTAQGRQGGGVPLKTIIGLLLGFMLGIVIAFIVETMDTSIGTIEDVEEYLEVPVLAVIPHLPVEKMVEQLVEQNPQLAGHPFLNMFARLITQYDPKSPAAEAYRTLRTNLQFAIGGTGESIEQKNTFAFTSSSLQEGKSTTMANLAITIAQAGNRVLLMGCNMRRPTIYKSFGLTLETGMTDILTGQKEWRECVKGITDMMVGPLSLQNIMQMPGLDNLHIVTSGGIPPNPSELLSSPRFSEMITEASEEYDIVLVDCPPVLPVTDAAIVGRQVDWSVLIYQVGKVPRNALRRAKFHLSNVGAHVLGLAMNDVKAEIGGYSPYSQYMIKYYGEDAPEKKTLLDTVRGIFKKAEKPFEEKREHERSESPWSNGDRSESAWIKVDYFDDIEDGSTGDNKIEDGTGIVMPEPKWGDVEDERTRGEAKHRRIPLWIWIALAVAVILLVVSIILDPFSETTAQSVYSPPSPAITERAAPPPDETTAATDQSVAGTSIWTVHVGSFRIPGEAESLRTLLSNLDLTGATRVWTRIEEVPGLGRWHRVFFGMYEEESACARSAELLRGTGQVTQARIRRVTPPSP